MWTTRSHAFSWEHDLQMVALPHLCEHMVKVHADSNVDVKKAGYILSNDIKIWSPEYLPSGYVKIAIENGQL